MSTVLGVTEASLREYMRLETSTSNSSYSDSTLGSNLRASADFLERATHRYFADKGTVTLKYTTNGDATVALPGLRTVATVTLASAALTLDTSYWLIPDAMQTGLFMAVQVRPFAVRPGGPAYLSYPDWFDTNKDHPRWGLSSMPNDLVLVGEGGYTDATLPEGVKQACKVLAGYYTKRPDSLLAGATQTPDGSIFDLSHLPIEVQDFVRLWGSHEQAATVG